MQLLRIIKIIVENQVIHIKIMYLIWGRQIKIKRRETVKENYQNKKVISSAAEIIAN